MDNIYHKYDVILFDFDGTLINSAKGLSDTLNKVIATQNMSSIPLDIMRPFTGIGSRQMLQCAYDYHKNPLSLEKKEALRELFLAYYEEFFLEDITPFDGADRLLRDLHTKQKKLILATNKPRRYTIPMIEALGWEDLFMNVTCSDDVRRPKPHPEHLEYALDQIGEHGKNALMVGDSSADYLSAIGANIDIAIVTFYQNDRDQFKEATYFIDSFLPI